MKPAAAPAQLPGQPSLRPDSATPRGIGRPPVRDHNMLMHGVRAHSPAAWHIDHLPFITWERLSVACVSLCVLVVAP